MASDAEEIESDAEEIESAMRRLVCGIVMGSWKDAYRAHRTLYRAGSAAIPILEHQLGQSDWNELQRPQTTRLVTAMVALLRDIDEPRSDLMIEGIIQGGCHSAVRSSLLSIQRYSDANFRKYDVRGISVFEAREIDPDQHIGTHLTNWLEFVPRTDLQEIERLYIVEPHETTDYAGKYMPILKTITVVWSSLFENRNPMSTFFHLGTQHTLYHEIGHHVHRHDFGQDPEQEREANRYAALLLARAHPCWAPLARFTRWAFRIRC